MKLENESFTIYDVEELKKTLIEELHVYKDVVIDLSNIQKIDMPAIQLLLALKKSCKDMNKGFELKNIDENIYKAFQLSGCDTALGV